LGKTTFTSGQIAKKEPLLCSEQTIDNFAIINFPFYRFKKSNLSKTTITAESRRIFRQCLTQEMNMKLEIKFNR